jgi:hypothetical protein
MDYSQKNDFSRRDFSQDMQQVLVGNEQFDNPMCALQAPEKISVGYPG